jgi:2-dehydro-3-deoxyphosphogluconate aldolase/(4S)-4-hydroxy-2-oxoglutarate aldolase
MVSDDGLLDALRSQRLLAILRGPDRDALLRAGLTLIGSGVCCLEVSLTSTDALGVITDLVTKSSDDALIGVGTVRSRDDAARARDAGAQFAVTPGLGDGVDGARDLGLPVLGGALTPTEVLTASTTCDAVKLFPASLGGPAYLRALRDPLPDIALVPVGGVDLALAPSYLAAGALAVGVGSPLLGDAPTGGDITELRRRACAFLKAVAERPL